MSHCHVEARLRHLASNLGSPSALSPCHAATPSHTTRAYTSLFIVGAGFCEYRVEARQPCVGPIKSRVPAQNGPPTALVASWSLVLATYSTSRVSSSAASCIVCKGCLCRRWETGLRFDAMALERRGVVVLADPGLNAGLSEWTTLGDGAQDSPIPPYHHTRVMLYQAVVARNGCRRKYSVPIRRGSSYTPSICPQYRVGEISQCSEGRPKGLYSQVSIPLPLLIYFQHVHNESRHGIQARPTPNPRHWSK